MRYDSSFENMASALEERLAATHTQLKEARGVSTVYNPVVSLPLFP